MLNLKFNFTDNNNNKKKKKKKKKILKLSLQTNVAVRVATW